MVTIPLIPFASKKYNDIAIEVEFFQNSESIFINYYIVKGLEKIDLGNTTPSKMRLMNLWEKSCFELFIKNKNDQYIEFNFSPNYEWNCFYFEKSQAPLMEFGQMPSPKIETKLSNEHFSLLAEINKSFFPDGFFNGKFELNAGITSVVKEKNGSMSYWALVHSDNRPNFHHFDSFIYKF